MSKIHNIIDKVNKKNEHKFPNKLREKIANELNHNLYGFAVRYNLEKDLLDFMLFLSSPIASPDLSSNFVTKTFFEDNFPTIKNNPIFPYFLKTIYPIKQKNYGAGEALFAMFFDDIQQAGKIGDFIRNGRHLELKDVQDAASLKAHADSSFRPSNNAFKQLYGKKETGLKQFWDGSLSTFEQFCKVVYPQFSKKTIEEVHSFGDDEKCRQHLGCLVLQEYKKIDHFDNLIAMKPNKNGDLSLLNIVDFNDYSFIKQNLAFTPVLYRGKGTQALGDGYCDIKLK